MMVELAFTPVVHEHGEIKIVGSDNRAAASNEICRADPAFDVATALDDARDPLIEGYGRASRRPRETLLQPGRHGVDPPVVDFKWHATKGCRGINIKKNVVLAAKPADLGKR